MCTRWIILYHPLNVLWFMLLQPLPCVDNKPTYIFIKYPYIIQKQTYLSVSLFLDIGGFQRPTFVSEYKVMFVSMDRRLRHYTLIKQREHLPFLFGDGYAILCLEMQSIAEEILVYGIPSFSSSSVFLVKGGKWAVSGHILWLALTCTSCPIFGTCRRHGMSPRVLAQARSAGHVPGPGQGVPARFFKFF